MKKTNRKKVIFEMTAREARQITRVVKAKKAGDFYDAFESDVADQVLLDLVGQFRIQTRRSR